MTLPEQRFAPSHLADISIGSRTLHSVTVPPARLPNLQFRLPAYNTKNEKGAQVCTLFISCTLSS